MVRIPKNTKIKNTILKKEKIMEFSKAEQKIWDTMLNMIEAGENITIANVRLKCGGNQEQIVKLVKQFKSQPAKEPVIEKKIELPENVKHIISNLTNVISEEYTKLFQQDLELSNREIMRLSDNLSQLEQDNLLLEERLTETSGSLNKVIVTQKLEIEALQQKSKIEAENSKEKIEALSSNLEKSETKYNDSILSNRALEKQVAKLENSIEFEKKDNERLNAELTKLSKTNADELAKLSKINADLLAKLEKEREASQVKIDKLSQVNIETQKRYADLAEKVLSPKK